MNKVRTYFKSSASNAFKENKAHMYIKQLQYITQLKPSAAQLCLDHIKLLKIQGLLRTETNFK